MTEKRMYQVELRKGSNIHVAWIEERGARVGAVVELKLGDGVRDPRWAVTQVWGSQPESLVYQNAEAYKYHRGRTDV